MSETPSSYFWPLLIRLAVVFSLFIAATAILIFPLHWIDRQRELALREEQSNHRLEVAQQLVMQDFQRVRSDLLYLAHQSAVSNADLQSNVSKSAVESMFASFLEFEENYQQLRLINESGAEIVRVELRDGIYRALPTDELQDKSERYYFRQSLSFNEGDVFVSEFDLNQEYGEIERPLNPVVRFATPVSGRNTNDRLLLVANYAGRPILRSLEEISLPGSTFVVRSDGQYLLATHAEDAWGWLLGHGSSFAKEFNSAWDRRTVDTDVCLATEQGLFSFRTVELNQFGRADLNEASGDDGPGATRAETEAANGQPSLRSNEIIIVSWIPTEEVFIVSNQLFGRLYFFAGLLSPLVALAGYFWSAAAIRRREQTSAIQRSESRLRDLSARLIRAQEEERLSIAREIHDQMGRQATAVNLDLKTALRLAESDGAKFQLKMATEESERLIVKLHEFATRIRPVELDDLGLHDAVEEHLENFSKRTGIPFKYTSNLETHKPDLPVEVSENIYRLIQDSLNNVKNHQRVSKVEVSLSVLKNRLRSYLCVTIEDDGVATNDTIETESQSSGVIGIRERVDLLAGSFEASSSPDAGTKIRVHVPLMRDGERVKVFPPRLN